MSYLICDKAAQARQIVMKVVERPYNNGTVNRGTSILARHILTQEVLCRIRVQLDLRVKSLAPIGYVREAAEEIRENESLMAEIDGVLAASGEFR